MDGFENTSIYILKKWLVSVCCHKKKLAPNSKKTGAKKHVMGEKTCQVISDETKIEVNCHTYLPSTI